MKQLGPIPRPVLTGGIAQILGAVALVGFMFLPWYGLGSSITDQFQGIDVSGLGLDLDVNAWRAFSGTDAGLLLCALVFASMGLALAIGDGVGMGRTAVRVLSILALIFAALTTVVIFIKIVNPPGQIDLSLKIGPFLALAASLIA